MPGNDLDLLVDAAQRAGALASPFWRNEPRTWDKGDGAGPVTEADLAVDTMLKETLLAARPDYGWLSEETEDDGARLKNEHVFIVDPIDGTRAFLAGERSWAHSIAVAREGEIVSAVVFLPMRDRLFTGQLGQGAKLNGAEIKASVASQVSGATVLSARPNLDAAHWRGGTPPVKRHFRPSLAYRLALVGQGRFDAMLTLRDTWEWDVAAGALIAQEAGATISDRLGHSVVFNNPVPKLPGLLAGSKAIHSALIERLS